MTCTSLLVGATSDPLVDHVETTSDPLVGPVETTADPLVEPVETTSDPLVEPVETIAVDAGATTVAAAERLLHDLEELLGPASWATTHFVGGRVVVVADVTDTERTGDVADRLALVGHRDAAVVVSTGSTTQGGWTAEGGSTTEVSGDLAVARRRHLDRSSGRLVRFHGRETIERETTVGEVLTTSAVDEVTALGGAPLSPDDRLDLREWARPELRAGRAVLVVQQGPGGLVPFESREQRPCCSAH